MFKYNGKVYGSWESAMRALMEKHPYAGDDDLCELADMYIEDLDDDSGEYYEDMDGDHDSAMASIGWGTDEDYGYYGGGEDW